MNTLVGKRSKFATMVRKPTSPAESATDSKIVLTVPTNGDANYSKGSKL